MKVVELPVSKRFSEHSDLYNNLMDAIMRNAEGQPIVVVVGVLRLIEADLLRGSHDG